MIWPKYNGVNLAYLFLDNSSVKFFEASGISVSLGFKQQLIVYNVIKVERIQSVIFWEFFKNLFKPTTFKKVKFLNAMYND
jgi:hypothetical protein